MEVYSFMIQVEIFIIIHIYKKRLNGNLIFDRMYGGTGLDRGNSVQQTSDGGFILSGTTDGDHVIIKTNILGDEQWSENCDWGNLGSLFKTNDDGFVLTGSTNSSSNKDILLIKFNGSGNCSYEWTRLFIDNNDNEMGYDVIQTNDDGYIIFGNTFASKLGLRYRIPNIN